MFIFIFVDSKDVNIHKTMRHLISTMLIFCLLGGMFITSSCNQEIDSYKLEVIVTVFDTTEVQNALVHIFAPVDNTFLDYYVFTDEEGKASVTLDNEAVVEIVAGKTSFRGCAFAEVNEEFQKVRIDLKPESQASINGCIEDN